jgi:hypothetical protein
LPWRTTSRNRPVRTGAKIAYDGRVFRAGADARKLLESSILFGQNVASYKFALSKSLIELSASGNQAIKLEALAGPFSRHIVEHLAKAPSFGPFAEALLAQR